jgi:GNAT superfamily N-acetyltransferase
MAVFLPSACTVSSVRFPPGISCRGMLDLAFRETTGDKVMMVIEGKEAIGRVDWQRVRTIIAEAGLNERDVQQLEQAFRQSTFCWFGYENGQLIAVARAISDCTWSSYLADVAIVPARQGQGYGQQLMLAIREQLLPFGKIFIYAVADKITFYQRFGFAMLTTGMVCASEEGMQKHAGAGLYPSALKAALRNAWLKRVNQAQAVRGAFEHEKIRFPRPEQGGTAALHRHGFHFPSLTGIAAEKLAHFVRVGLGFAKKQAAQQPLFIDHYPTLFLHHRPSWRPVYCGRLLSVAATILQSEKLQTVYGTAAG